MQRIRLATLAAMGLSLLFARNTQAAIVTTVEAPGVQVSSAIDTTSINFDSATPGYHGSEIFTPSGSLTVDYEGNQFIEPAGQYGGAGGTGQYYSLQSTGVVTATLSTSQAYFGLWVSAADAYNEIDFYNGNTLVGSFSAVGPLMSSLPSSYLGNPNPAFSGQNPTENYAFVNFYAQGAGDMFNKIVFTNLAGPTEFESDNHTFSATLQAPSAVPEPSTMISSGIALVMLSGAWLRKKARVSSNA